MNHILKTDKLPFQAVLDDVKNFEFRLNDRGYKVGDQLTLNEVDENKIYTGRSCKVQVTYILNKGYGIPKDYCVMSILKSIQN